MTQKSELGQFGEDLACKYLVDKGYKIIERNFRKPWGELDIVVRAPDKTLVFVEVKTMSQNEDGIKPEDQLTKAKLHKTQKAASLYAGHYLEKINDKKGWRIDLIALTISGKSCD
ncbi:MAG: YraN family protein, partial [Candidatus Sungbacteria bacterium]|nr:YraN family protein [Candidatus Sungbacteria bacterium]